MASKQTGFHPQDAEWTRGREQAVADAESIARRQIGMTRTVTLKGTANARAALRAIELVAALDPAAIREAAIREAVEAYPQGIGAILALIQKGAADEP